MFNYFKIVDDEEFVDFYNGMLTFVDIKLMLVNLYINSIEVCFQAL